MGKQAVLGALQDWFVARMLVGGDQKIEEWKADVEKIRMAGRHGTWQREEALLELAREVLKSLFRPEHFSLEWLYQNTDKNQRAAGIHALYRRGLDLGSGDESLGMEQGCRLLDLGEEDLAYTRIAIHFMQLCVDSSDIPSRIAMRICRFLEKAEIQGGLKERATSSDFNRKASAQFFNRSRRIYQSDRCLKVIGVKPAFLRHQAIGELAQLTPDAVRIQSTNYRGYLNRREADFLGIQPKK